jgi:REP element-mobilizing transposase RayT
MAWKRQKSYRLKGFDYTRNRAYFVTIVCKDRKPAFGEIIDGKMCLSAIGEFVKQHLKSLSKRKQKDMQIDEYQVMPDHVHLLVTIANNTRKTPTKYPAGIHPLIPGSLGSFINHFKGKVTRWCNEQAIEGFAWQGRFNDRIIRDDSEYRSTTIYIRNNVRNWGSKGDFDSGKT